MQCACVILSSVAWPALQYLSTLSHKRHDFRKKMLNIKLSFDFLCNFSLKRFSVQEEPNQIWSKMYIGLHVKHPSYLSDFNGTWISQQIFEIYWMSNLMKIRQLGDEFFLTDRRMDRQTDIQIDKHDESNSRFMQLCERS